MLLFIVSNGAMAEWDFVTETDNSYYYADRDAIIKKGNIVKMWVMVDFNSPQKLADKTYLSIRSMYEFNCVEVTATTKSMDFYSANMLDNGEIVSSAELNKYRDIAPNTALKELWKTACGKQ